MSTALGVKRSRSFVISRQRGLRTGSKPRSSLPDSLLFEPNQENGSKSIPKTTKTSATGASDVNPNKGTKPMCVSRVGLYSSIGPNSTRVALGSSSTVSCSTSSSAPSVSFRSIAILLTAVSSSYSLSCSPPTCCSYPRLAPKCHRSPNCSANSNRTRNESASPLRKRHPPSIVGLNGILPQSANV